jgi:hypothetical protein
MELFGFLQLKDRGDHREVTTSLSVDKDKGKLARFLF